MATDSITRERQLIKVTAGNIQNSHLYFQNPDDFFPSDVVGGSKSSTPGRQIEIELAGMGETALTDVGSRPGNGKARNFFRERSWVRRFYKHHRIRAGDLLAMERTGERTYRLSVQRKLADDGQLFTAAEFFAGIGLVRLALEHQNWTVRFANDIDEDKAEMYRHNWPDDDHLVVGDIHKLDADEIPTVDLFTASFPCNDLSIAGKWEGLNGKESSAFWGLTRIIRDMGKRKPKVVLLENVLGFLKSQGGRDFEQALLALNDLGYAVDAFILNASHWTPQSRVRLFVVAKLEEGREPPLLMPETEARPAELRRFIQSHPNISWSIAELPPLPQRKSQLKDMIEKLPDDDPNWWNEERTTYFMNQLSDKHAAIAQQMIAGKSYSYATAFRRVRYGRSMAELRTDGIAGCLRTPRGGSGRQILFKAGSGKHQVRLLTARECARLQGVPESFEINVELNQALFGFGDAVCVPAVEWIVENYISLHARRS